ncbi:MAG: IS91 family transposase, partial [Gammaproteobacteria bacterium]|nr:IS91 family transposase [Gammaproteobacteria bacterium]
MKAVTAFMRCRTAAMDGHLQCCTNGHIEKAHYNSCKHRNCPLCNALPSARWLEKQQAMLLDCDHYHAIFTLPHYLLALWQHNTRLITDLLFRCAIETLRKLLDDPR